MATAVVTRHPITTLGCCISNCSFNLDLGDHDNKWDENSDQKGKENKHIKISTTHDAFLGRTLNDVTLSYFIHGATMYIEVCVS